MPQHARAMEEPLQIEDGLMRRRCRARASEIRETQSFQSCGLESGFCQRLREHLMWQVYHAQS